MPTLSPDTSARAASGAAVTVRMFAAARQEAGTGCWTTQAATVAEVLAAATATFGPGWASIARSSRVWVNGEPAEAARSLCDGDEVAVLPPVSGGSA